MLAAWMESTELTHPEGWSVEEQTDVSSSPTLTGRLDEEGIRGWNTRVCRESRNAADGSVWRWWSFSRLSWCCLIVSTSQCCCWSVQSYLDSLSFVYNLFFTSSLLKEAFKIHSLALVNWNVILNVLWCVFLTIVWGMLGVLQSGHSYPSFLESFLKLFHSWFLLSFLFFLLLFFF